MRACSKQTTRGSASIASLRGSIRGDCPSWSIFSRGVLRASVTVIVTVSLLVERYTEYRYISFYASIEILRKVNLFFAAPITVRHSHRTQLRANGTYADDVVEITANPDRLKPSTGSRVDSMNLRPNPPGLARGVDPYPTHNTATQQVEESQFPSRDSQAVYPRRRKPLDLLTMSSGEICLVWIAVSGCSMRLWRRSRAVSANIDAS